MKERNINGRIRKIIILSLFVVAIVTMGFSTALGKNVVLNINGQKKNIVTYSKTVEEFLKTEKIELKNRELVNPNLDTEIEENMEIKIISPKSYIIKDGNKTLITEAQGESVGDVLRDLGIDLNEFDRVSPSVTEKATQGMTIKIDRIEKKSTEEEVEINFESKEQKNDQKYESEVNIIQIGVKGLQRNTIETTYVNGVPSKVEVVKSQIIQEPIDEIKEVGTKKPEVKGLEGKRIKAVYVMQATAYDPTAGSRTAMGTRARVGAVAVDPRVIPLGSKLYIESMDGFPTYGYAVAEDTGGAIKGKRIDLFYSTNAQANRFGRRNVKVYVIE